MNKNLLLPTQFRIVGWCMFIPAIILGAGILGGMISTTGIMETVTNDAAIIAIALGAVFLTCSKERDEDEMTQAIRLGSLLTSLYIYVAIVVAATLLINGIDYYYFMAINLALFPLIFTIVFKMRLYRSKRLQGDD